MMAQMVSAAPFLILLLLPLKSCLPLEWPRPALSQVLPIRGLSWDRWLSRSEWEDNASVPPVGSEEGPFQEQRSPRSCKPTEAKSFPEQEQQQQRAERASSSSKRRDGRPNSLDLTFHLLREFLEMSREERLAQKARSNKILLHNIGK
ncbi:corticoliberin-like [Rhineura floridana]|uniref:corticoliberin-like n=1 Tax=Rhineura floridana TaxID=261503 RepID=UPI002AC8265D|nr:corticoliberin-like [Rhineura floridana]